MTAQGFRPNQMYPITSPDAAVHTPPEGRCWSMVESEYKKQGEYILVKIITRSRRLCPTAASRHMKANVPSRPFNCAKSKGAKSTAPASSLRKSWPIVSNMTSWTTMRN
jgi:hypothetical protein